VHDRTAKEVDSTEDQFDPVDSLDAYTFFKERIDGIHRERIDRVTAQPPDMVRFDRAGFELSNIRLPTTLEPKVSILIPVYNESSYTIECIASIARTKPAIDYEIIIANDASPDPAILELGKIDNIVLINQLSNIGFLRNCNAAFQHCRGEYLFLLNNDTQLTAGSLDALVAVLDSHADVGAVGPKMLYPNGRLQEAGCAIDRYGVATMIGLFQDPEQPAFSYARDVDYCSGAALLVRRSALNNDSLFDPVFEPAYCEDADLCLQLLSAGHRVVYCPDSVVIHHLSVSTNRQSATKRMQLVVRNQHKLLHKWSSFLETRNRARVIAFYLPQFYPTKENDFHWGRGFTEWSNVTRAQPAYKGHYQPHLPADLGFYDLRVKQVFEQQAALGRRYGIFGFCVYYYNFGSRRVLDEPFEAMVADSSIDFPYCVCWANENWTRHWDGGKRDLLFEQEYSASVQHRIIADAVRYARDPRYIRVDDKPLLLVYRPLLLPDPLEFTVRCRASFRDAGFKDVHLAYVEGMETANEAHNPNDLGFDACVEFPPQGRAVPRSTRQPPFHESFSGAQYDYEATVLKNVAGPSTAYKRYPAVFPSWDNTSRQPTRGDSFVGATPEVFQAYVEAKLDELYQQFVGDERLLFVNAWNEWAEGTHLEPDRRFGHRWLAAIQNALMAKGFL
jgi:GT2 family glycosyltransferase